MRSADQQQTLAVHSLCTLRNKLFLTMTSPPLGGRTSTELSKTGSVLDVMISSASFRPSKVELPM